MRNILLASAAALVLAAGAQANCAKSNWSVGLQAGGQWTKADTKNNDGSRFNKSTYGTAPIALTLDWTKSAANSWLYGFGVEAGYVAGNPSKSFNSEGINYKAKFQPTWFGGFNARLGWDFGNKWNLYGLVAVRVQKNEYKLYDAAGTQLSANGNKKSVFGAGIGAGAGVSLTERVALDLQYRHYWEQDMKFSDAKVKLNSHLALLKLSYKL
ncbi:MAG: outer membrane beta-barrel protein [Proteobacteria bacterium]|nr:outer membrane beta-barrel protein [Pseudomonadota bacterium]